MGGVLLSWAVPRGPSLDPAEKRMAVLTEDHPLGYADFEAVIPAGNYGAGPMILWDRGRWIPIEDPVAGMEKGKLLFELKGYKLRGVWTLVRTKGKGNEWLLIKKPDGEAAKEGTRPFRPESVLSGLTLEELRDGAHRAEAIRATLTELGAQKKKIDPDSVKPMLAETAEGPFSDPGWIFELKYDGFRLIVSRDGAGVKLRFRSGIDATHLYPEIVRAIAAWPFPSLILDGEVVILGDDARPSFNKMQHRLQLQRPVDLERAMIAEPATLYAFDLLAFDALDLRSLPLEERKRILARIVPATGPVRYSDHVEGAGEALFKEVQRLGLEGIMAKDKRSPYRAGRSSGWLKIRTEQTGDFVVVGFSKPKGSRSGFGALQLAVFEPGAAGAAGRLVYAGRVGSGFDEASLERIRAELDREVIARPACEGPVPKKDAIWVRPRWVAEVRYLEYTDDGLIRHPVFVRLRDDKEIEACTRVHKIPHAGDDVVSAPTPAALADSLGAGANAAPGSESPPPGSRSPVTNAHKIFWPKDGYTKGDLYAYYRDISPWLLPYLRDRPVVVVRYPDGIDGKSFFQKDAPGFVPGWLRTERMWSDQASREIDHFVPDDLDGLLYLINLGAIPLHVWGSRVTDLPHPDWCILDLDPKGAPFDDVIKVAQAIRALCEHMDLPCFAKTSGSSGMHVLIPLGRQFTFEQAKSMAELIARVVAKDLPEIATVARHVQNRGGRVYLDYLQNGHGKLLVSIFSVRPLPGAPVSMPLEWREVQPGLDPGQFTIKTAIARMEKLGRDPMAEVLVLEPDLRHALQKLSERVR